MTPATRGRALRLLRAYRALTQEQLGQAARVSKATISAYEHARMSVGPDNLERLLQALGLSLTSFDAACRLVEQLDANEHTDSAEELARSAGHHAEHCVRSILRALLVDRGVQR